MNVILFCCRPTKEKNLLYRRERELKFLYTFPLEGKWLLTVWQADQVWLQSQSCKRRESMASDLKTKQKQKKEPEVLFKMCLSSLLCSKNANLPSVDLTKLVLEIMAWNNVFLEPPKLIYLKHHKGSLIFPEADIQYSFRCVLFHSKAMKINDTHKLCIGAKLTSYDLNVSISLHRCIKMKVPCFRYNFITILSIWKSVPCYTILVTEKWKE